MQVIRAAEMGLCFGVRDALATVRAIERPRDVTIHGELVHNEEVNRDLAERGFATQREGARSAIPATPRVLITAHGVSETERRRLADAGKELIDTTCPLVQHVHERARELAAAGYLVVVIGRRGHVEVEGITGDLERFEVVADDDEARPLGVDRIGLVCQSTMRPDEAAAIHLAIARANPDAEIRYEETICGPTRNRQLALDALLERVDALVVVGGRNSNNSRALALRARSRGVPATLVRNADELEPSWFCRFRVVGLTAGTSTPDATIEAVAAALATM